MIDLRTIAFIIGYLIGMALSQAHGAEQRSSAPWIVKVANSHGPYTDLGSGTIVARDGQRALVLTVRHIFTDGVGDVVVTQSTGARWHGVVIAIDPSADVSAVMIRDPGDVQNHPGLARRQPARVTIAGYGRGGGRVAAISTGDRVSRTDDGDYFYSLRTVPGDSGSGGIDPAGDFSGVMWGDSAEIGGSAFVGLARIKVFLTQSRVSSYFVCDGGSCRMVPVRVAPRQGVGGKMGGGLLGARFDAGTRGVFVGDRGGPKNKIKAKRGNVFIGGGIATPAVYERPPTAAIEASCYSNAYAAAAVPAAPVPVSYGVDDRPIRLEVRSPSGVTVRDFYPTGNLRAHLVLDLNSLTTPTPAPYADVDNSLPTPPIPGKGQPTPLPTPQASPQEPRQPMQLPAEPRPMPRLPDKSPPGAEAAPHLPGTE